MKIFIRRSGGMANVPLEGEVDTKDLSRDLRRKAEAMMHTKNLRALSSAKGGKTPDVYQYEIRVGEEDAFEAFTLDEGMVGDDERDVLDGLTRELRRRKRKGGAGKGNRGR
jgi:hypothetical protein